MKKIFTLYIFPGHISQKLIAFFFIIIQFFLSEEGFTQTISVSIAADKDNTIYERNNNNSNGAGEFMIAGTTGSPYFNHALIKFDIAGNIPAGARILSATLTLHLAGTSGHSGPHNIELHRLLQDWGEGTSNAGPQAGQGAPATVNDATWINAFHPASSWTTAGGTYVQGNSAVSAVDQIGFYSWSSTGMVTEIQNWLLNPSVNYGWLLKSDESTSFQAKKFESRQNPVVANRPVLNIIYNIPLEAPIATAATSLAGNNFTANWNQVSNASGYFLDVSTSAAFGTALAATDIFISEYVEGSGNNKYIEIYNGTPLNVNLSDYRLRLYANGDSTPVSDVVLSGILATGTTVVYKNSLSTIYSAPAAINSAINFDGNDAIALFRISTNSNVDIFGRIGENPGTEWNLGNVTTNNKTLVRKATVRGGISINPGAGFPTLSDWDVFNTDDVTHLGTHNFISFVPSFINGYENLSVNGLSQVVTVQTPYLAYYYRVRAVNNTGTSANSNVIEAQIPCGCLSGADTFSKDQKKEK